MARTGIFFGTTTRQVAEGDVVETFSNGHVDRGTVHRVDRATQTIEVDFGGEELRVWRPAWGKEANGAIHVSLFMERGDPRLSEGVYDSARAVHGETKV